MSKKTKTNSKSKKSQEQNPPNEQERLPNSVIVDAVTEFAILFLDPLPDKTQSIFRCDRFIL